MKVFSKSKSIMNRSLLTAIGLFIFISGNHSQELLWQQSTNYDNIIGAKLGVDNDNNVYSLFYGFSEYNLNKYGDDGMLLWSKSDTNWSSIGDIYTTGQGIIYLAGSKKVSPNDLDAYCVVFNAQGLYQYEGYYSMTNTSSEVITDILVDDDGYAYLSGYGIIDTVFHVFTYRMNPGGTISWAQTENFDNEHYVQIAGLLMDDIDNLYLSGIHVTGPDSVENFIIKYSTNGQHIFTKKYLKTGYTTTLAYRLIPDPDQNLIFVGGVGTSTITRGYVAKLDHNGEVIWDHTFNPASNQMGLYSADLDEDGNIYVSGQIEINNNHEGYYAKISSDGVVIWEDLYVGPATSYDGIYKVLVEGDACYWAGQTMGITTKSDIVLLKTDTAGNIAWESRYDGAAHNQDQYEDFLLCPDHNIVISGITEEIYQDNFGTTIKYANPTFIHENRYPAVELSVYPNPARESLHLSRELKGTYCISDMGGTKNLSGELKSNEIDVSTLNPGVYLLYFMNGSITYYAKFVKQ